MSIEIIKPSGGVSSTIAIGETITGNTPGGILFGDAANELAQDATQLFWDDTNNRLGIGTATPSEKLQIDSVTRGFLPPRMTNAQRAAIVSPTEGILLYNTTNNGVAYYDGTNFGYLSGAAQTIAGSGGTVNIPFASGNIVNLTLTASTTLTLSGHVVGVYILKVIQGGSGSYTLTYPATVKWSGGSAPTLTTTVGKTDIITLFHDGTNFFGTYSLNY
jgi:hypothetical protein